MIVVPVDPDAHRIVDAIAWGSALLGGWLVARWRLADARKNFPQRPGYLIALAFGAILGAYLAGSLPSLMSGTGSLSHSVAGALAGAIVGVELYKLANGVKQSTGAVFVAPFTIGIVIGRWGCLFAGLSDGTHGTPTSLPFGVDLGDGVARHPVQVYESLAMLMFFIAWVAALAARKKWALTYGFYAMVIFYGAQRFFWEFLKPYPTIVGPFNLFHFISLGLVIYGCVWIARARRQAA